MCIISAVSDGYHKDFFDKHPWIPVQPQPFTPNPVGPIKIEKPMVVMPDLNRVTRQEFDELKKEIEELRLLLLAAKRYDEQTGQPNCAMEEKVEFILRMGELLGVDMTQVFGSKTTSPAMPEGPQNEIRKSLIDI